MPSHRLPLTCSVLDRHAELRSDQTLVERLLKDSRTKVTLLVGDLLAVLSRPLSDGIQLALHSPQEAQTVIRALGTLGALPDSVSPCDEGPCLHVGPYLQAFLGQDHDEQDHVLLALKGPLSWPIEVPAASGSSAALDHLAWVGLRDIAPGPHSPETDLWVDLAVTSLALAQWHAGEGHCPACAAPTRIENSGWTRRCSACQREYYPRTDPAVIMTVLDDHDRLLLGRHSTWGENRYSLLAGFAEPGECLEDAVRREVHEEAGIQVGRVEYRASQPWPFPRSLMIGFQAQATSTTIRVDGDELQDAGWWSRAELQADLESGAVILPPPLSIANALMAQWFGGPLPTCPT